MNRVGTVPATILGVRAIKPPTEELTMTRNANTFDLADALTASRIDWNRIEEEGYDIEQIAREAAMYGDDDLVRKARRAIARRK